MMDDAVMHMPEEPPMRRPESEQVLNTEQPVMKRQKLSDPKPAEPVFDTAMELQSDSDSDWDDPLDANYDESYGYCLICRKIVSSHTLKECPNKSRAFGMFCFVCEGPCKSSTDEHKEDQAERIKTCSNCYSRGRHWTQDCPYSDNEDAC